MEQLDNGNTSHQFGNMLKQALKMGGTWRDSEDWSVQSVQQISHQYAGLKNLAATCYINSLLQQLFFIDSFSSNILSIEADKIDDK